MSSDVTLRKRLLLLQVRSSLLMTTPGTRSYFVFAALGSLLLVGIASPACSGSSSSSSESAGNGASGAGSAAAAVGTAASGGSAIQSAAEGDPSAGNGGMVEGGTTAAAGMTAAGGTMSEGGTMAAGGTTATGGTGVGGAASGDLGACYDPGLIWKSARKTTFTSYPDPGSTECIDYSGCMYAGLFAFCDAKQSEQWVSEHDIAAAFPADGLEHHRLCLDSGGHRMIVEVLDTCADSDCDGCCTANKADNDALIDLESYTDARWGLPDGVIQWADLGPNPNPICQ